MRLKPTFAKNRETALIDSNPPLSAIGIKDLQRKPTFFPRFCYSRSAMKTRKASGKPEALRVGSLTATLYRAKKTVGGREYEIFRLVYVEPGGGRKVRDFGSREKAKAIFEEVAKAYALGRPDALSWSAKERAEFDAAAQALEGSGVGIFGAVQQFLAAQSRQQYPAKTVSEVAQELARDREAAGCSEEHVRDITKRLEPFAKAFQCQIGSVNPPLVRDYLTKLRGVKGQPLTGRSKDNARRMIVTLFNFARQQRYVPRELADEIAEIPAPKIETVTSGIFTPDGIARILAAAEGPDQVLLAVGAFAGLRTAELHRLEWQDVRLAERVLIVGAEKAKTASRRVIPIAENLAEWLSAHVQPTGKISRYSHEHALSWGVMKIARGAGVPWVKNGLRHSFCSYRLAVTKNAAQVAHEAGNSPAVVHRHYASLVTESQGKAWFDVRPARAENIIHLGAVA